MAATTPISAPSRVNCSTTDRVPSIVAGHGTSSPAASARASPAHIRLRPRPRGLSGCVTTARTRWDEASIALARRTGRAEEDDREAVTTLPASAVCESAHDEIALDAAAEPVG